MGGYLDRDDAETSIVFDAIRMRLLEIGEATKALTSETRALAPDAEWDDVIRMRDLLAHRYSDTLHAIVMAVAREDAPRLSSIAARILPLVDRDPR